MQSNQIITILRKSLILIPLAVAIVLSACGGGGGSSGPNPDFQNFATSSSSSGYVLAGSASQCRQIAVNGTCTVGIGYLAESGSAYINGPVTFINLPVGYTSNISSCPNVESTTNSCNITITNTGGSTTSATFVSFAFNGTNLPTSIGFNIGGGF